MIRPEPFYRRDAFERGLKAVGFTLIKQSGVAMPTGPEDWLVIWNRQKDEMLADDWERRGGTVIVAENGYLQQIDKTYYAISVHGHNGSGWFPHDDGEDRFSALGYGLKPWKDQQQDYPGYELVIGQRGIGSKMMRSPVQWAEVYARSLRGKTTRQIKVRPHPGNFAPKVPLIKDLAGAACCNIWASAAGVLALVEGVPLRVAAPRWICREWSDDRHTVLNKMAHGQWHHTEIATGEPFARIIANREKAAW